MSPAPERILLVDSYDSFTFKSVFWSTIRRSVNPLYRFPVSQLYVVEQHRTVASTLSRMIN